MPKILVAEDDATLVEALVYNLRREQYETVVARTGLQAIVASRAERPDLILLDLMLPEIDGFEVCRTIRAGSQVPIIMLTARDSEEDSVLGLEMGADDYVTKPFRLRELLARIKAGLRRSEVDSVHQILTFADVTIDPAARAVRRRGEVIHLLPREFDLLLYLARNPGVTLTRSQILEEVWDSEYLGEARTVDVHIRRLRSKLEVDPARPALIRTVHRVGYTFNPGA